jgi:hypothetical protein
MYRIRIILFLADEGARLRPYTPSGLFWILREEEEQDSEHNYLYELFVEKRRAEANIISCSSWTFWKYETNCGREDKKSPRRRGFYTRPSFPTHIRSIS